MISCKSNLTFHITEKAPASKKNRAFTEGWVEFEDKKTAKIVARTLNNNQIGGKRRNPWYYELWNIKYLPKFQWAHLNERLAYERAVHKQRLRAEISQAKKETSKFIQNVERQKFRKRKAEPTDGDAVDRPFVFKQIKSDDQLSKKFKNPKQVVAMDQNFMKNIFSGGV